METDFEYRFFFSFEKAKKERDRVYKLIKDYNIKVPNNLKKMSEKIEFVDKYVLENFVVH